MYEIGEEVRIREDANIIFPPDGLSFDDRGAMLEYLGKVFKVTEQLEKYDPVRYRLDGTESWTWSEIWLDPPYAVPEITDGEFADLIK